jgi:hypothetical protein
MHVTNQQLRNLVLPILDKVCEDFQKMVRVALDSGKGIELDKDDRYDVAVWAAETGQTKLLKLILAAGVSPAGRGDAALSAADNGHTECLASLLKTGVSQYYLDESERRAKEFEHFECLKLLRDEKKKGDLMQAKSETRRFKVGDKVTWESHAQCNFAKKEGVVVEIVSSYTAPERYGFYSFRKTESYIIGEVLAERTVRGIRKMVPVKGVYWPIAKKLLQKGKSGAGTTR